MRLQHFGVDLRAHFRQKFIAHFATVFHGPFEFLKRVGLQVPKGEVFQFAPNLSHAQAVSNGRINLQSLARDAFATVGGEIFEGAHVVQPVRQFDQDDADIVHHGEQHLAEVLGLLLFGAQELDAADLGDAFDDARHFVAEILANALRGGAGVLKDVVQHARGETGRVQLHARQDQHHFQRVGNERLTGKALLRAVLRGGEIISLREQGEILTRAVGLHLSEDVLELNHTQHCHSSSLWKNRVAAAGRRTE